MLVRWWRSIVVVLLVVLVTAGLWVKQQVADSELPVLVNVTERLPDGSLGRQFEVRDRTFLIRLNEFFPGYRKLKPAGERPGAAHFQLDFIIRSEPHSTATGK